MLDVPGSSSSMISVSQTPLPSDLPQELSQFIRGKVLGALEGFDSSGGLHGWVCRWPQSNGETKGNQHPAAPLPVILIIEDLLDPSRNFRLAELIAQRPRSDLPSLEIERACGFQFLGSSGRELPPHSRGMVVRAFALAPEPYELAGSPLRLDAKTYAQLSELCQIGLGRPARLQGLEGHHLPVVARGAAPLQLRLEDGTTIAILPPDPLPQGNWLIRLPLPPATCDGRIHLLRLETADGELIDERLELVPFQITGWPYLLELSQAPSPNHLSPLAREHQRSLQVWLEQADRTGQSLPPQLPLWQRLINQPLRRDGKAPPLPPGCEPGVDGSPVPRPALQLPLSDEPRVTIVIPVHGQYAVTRRCLAAIAYAPTQVAYEVVVVDDGSHDQSAALIEAEAPGVRVICHEYAQGFNQACCSGAAAARAPFLVLLNNDTEPCAHWLEELLDPFERWPDTGLVGAQLIFPDGRLQVAGGIVWGNGEPWNYGWGGNPYDPRHTYSRQVDHVCGAALAIPSDLWRKVGGFSPEFSPAYYEDTDLAFKVRQAGCSVRYAPLARVIHHEGVSNGTDTESTQGLKRYQTINGPLFREKWSSAFEGDHEPSQASVERIKDRGIVGRALFIDLATPRPDRDAGSHAALVEMELLQALGWKVTFLPATPAWLGRYTEALQRRGIEAIYAPFVLSLEQLLRDRGSEFDLIYLTRYNVAANALPVIARYAPQARLLFCNADLHHLRELRSVRSQALEGEAAEIALDQVREVQQQELAVICQVHLTFSYSEVERAVIDAETLGAASTALCPWVVEGPIQPAPFHQRQGIAFLGNYNHLPNREAVEGFLDAVWPELQKRQPSLKLHLYGHALDADLAVRWGTVPGVNVEGWIAQASEVYDRHRVFIAPLRSGAGIKGKVAAAAAHGIPQVLSPIAAEATGLRHGQEIQVAREPEQWIKFIQELCSNETLWQAMSEASHRYASSTWSRERGLELMAEALQRLHLPVSASLR